MSDGAALSIGDSARIVGGYRWVEDRLFALTGAWAGEASHPGVALHLHEVSLQHAWHAELFAERLPVLDGVDPDELTAADGPSAGPLLAALAGIAGSGEQAEHSDGAPVPDEPTGGAPVRDRPPGGPGLADVRRLSGLYRVVVPRLLVTYDRHLGAAVPTTDGPLMRALRLVVRDELEAALGGEAQLQLLLVTHEAAAAAGDAVSRLEGCCLASPGGLAPWSEAARAEEG